MKKLFVCVLSLVLVLSMAACGGKQAAEASTTADTAGQEVNITGGENVQIPNPWQECSSLEEAGKLAGFSFVAPEKVEGFTERYIAAIENEIAQVIFSNGDDSDAALHFRKGVGTEDISGDYNTYETVEEQNIGGKTVTCKGNGGLTYTAIWTDGTYSYAVMSDTGMNAEQLETWVQSLA